MRTIINKTPLILLVLLLALSGCRKQEKEGFNNVYRTFYSTDPKTFNYTVTNRAEDTQFFANFVDGLYEGDRFGVTYLPALADGRPERVENEGYVTYTVKVKRDIPWSNSAGEIVSKYGFLKPSDFITTAKYTLDYRLNTSADSSAYMYITFLRGAEDYFNATVNASKDAVVDFDSMVGMRADDVNYTISYDLIENLNEESFKSALSYSCFLPLNDDFYRDIRASGINFGQIDYADSILYNGGYLVERFEKSYMAILKRNPNYWDVSSIKTEKINFLYYPEGSDPSIARKFFESKQVDGFTPQYQDTAGWRTYVTGKKNQGTYENPVHKNVQVIRDNTSSTIYYQSWNFKRTSQNNFVKLAETRFKGAMAGGSYADVNNGLGNNIEAQIRNTQKAINNRNFRLGYMHAYPRHLELSQYIPHNPQQWMRNTMTMRNFTSVNETVDYIDLVAGHYADANGISDEDAAAFLMDGNDAIYNLQLSKQYFAAAKAELEAEGVKFPVALVSPYYYTTAEKIIQEEYTKFFNGGTKGASSTIEQADYGQVSSYMFFLPVGLDYNGILEAIPDGFYDVSSIGWIPDYADPLTYVSTHCSTGTMNLYMNKLGKDDPDTAVVFASIDEPLATAKTLDTEGRLNQIALAEYRLIYEEGIVMPLYAPFIGTAIVVSRVVPYNTQRNPVGLGPDKFKGLMVQYKTLTNDERAHYKDIFDREKAEHIEALKSQGII